MTALLARRDDRCLSDLTMDRFLLGETSDSDEGRMLERHLVWCSACLARVQSLRTLYAHADMPEVTSEPAPVPTPGPMLAQRPDRVTGVLELILMRDGLLIGTEVFTPGVWILGSGPRANLKLDARGVAAEHARLTFHNDSVVVERAQGSVLVNGFRVERSEVRPIDELIVGPFVVRARVITGRWSEAAPKQEVPSRFAPTRRVRALTPPESLSVEVEDETQLVTVPNSPLPQGEGQGEGRTTPSPVARQVHAMAEVLNARTAAQDAGATARHSAHNPRANAHHSAQDPRANAQHSAQDPRANSAPSGANARAALALPADSRSAKNAPSERITSADAHAPTKPAGATALKLRLDLFWGDALQASELLSGEVPSSAFPAFAPGREPSASAVAGGFRLCIPGAKLELLQGTHWVRAGDELTLTANTRARVVDGALRLEARLQSAPLQVPPSPKTAFMRGAFVPVLSFLMLGLLVFAAVATTYEADEDEFAPRSSPKLSVSMLQPKPKTPDVRPPDKDTTTASNDTPKTPTRRPPPPAPAVRRPPPHLAGLSGMTKVLEAATKLTKLTLPNMAPGKSPRQGDLFAGLNTVGGKNNLGIGIGPDTATGIGIGAVGAKNAGNMRVGRIGKTGVAGQVLSPAPRDLGAPLGSIDRDAVLKVINSHLAEVSSCYERALLTNPSISGKLTFEWGIGVDGKVTVIKLKSATMKDASVPACISSSMKKWTFPKPRGGTVTVSFPFMFQPTGF